MNKQAFLDLIKHPSNISSESLKGLEEVVVNFPYCQSAHILIAKGFHEQGSMLTIKKLSKAAVYSYDRKGLKKFINSKHYMPKVGDFLTPIIEEKKSDVNVVNEPLTIVQEPENAIEKIQSVPSNIEAESPGPFDKNENLPSNESAVELSFNSVEDIQTSPNEETTPTQEGNLVELPFKNEELDQEKKPVLNTHIESPVQSENSYEKPETSNIRNWIAAQRNIEEILAREIPVSSESDTSILELSQNSDISPSFKQDDSPSEQVLPINVGEEDALKFEGSDHNILPNEQLDNNDSIVADIEELPASTETFEEIVAATTFEDEMKQEFDIQVPLPNEIEIDNPNPDSSEGKILEETPSNIEKLPYNQSSANLWESSLDAESRNRFFKELEQNLQRLREFREYSTNRTSSKIIEDEKKTLSDSSAFKDNIGNLGQENLPDDPVTSNEIDSTTKNSLDNVSEEETKGDDTIKYFEDDLPKNFRDRKEIENIIEKFIQEEPSIPYLDRTKVVENSVDLAEPATLKPVNIVSENFAKILEKQLKYDKAIEIYKQLTLKYPEKSAYFAALIENLNNKL